MGVNEGWGRDRGIGGYTMNYDRTKGRASRRYSVVVFFFFSSA